MISQNWLDASHSEVAQWEPCFAFINDSFVVFAKRPTSHIQKSGQESYSKRGNSYIPTAHNPCTGNTHTIAMMFRLLASLTLLWSCQLFPVSAGTETREIVQMGEQPLVSFDLNNETWKLDVANEVKQGLTAETVEEILIEEDKEEEYDGEEYNEDEEEYYDEDYYDEDEVGEQGSEAYSSTVSPPAMRVADAAGSDLGEPQVIDAVIGDEVKARISDARIYIQDSVMKFPEYEKVRDTCFNKHENCAFWAGMCCGSCFVIYQRGRFLIVSFSSFRSQGRM